MTAPTPTPGAVLDAEVVDAALRLVRIRLPAKNIATIVRALNDRLGCPTPEGGKESLEDLLKRATEAFAALPKEEQDRQFAEQKKRWVAAEMSWGDEGARLVSTTPAHPEPGAGELAPRGPITHEVKCWRSPFAAVKSGAKPWELRLNDRDYRVGDTLRQFEWDEVAYQHTGDQVEHLISWALYGPAFGLPEGYVIMTLTPADHTQAQAKIARLEGEVTERDARLLDWAERAERAIAIAERAEADAAKVREELAELRKDDDRPRR